MLSSPLAWSANYYVATTGDDSNAGTQAAPWKTFAKAAQVAGAGDTVYFRAGVYPGYVQLAKSGNAANPITFQAYAGETAIIDGSGRTTNIADPWQASDALIHVSGDYVTIRGLEIRNAATFGIYVNGDYVVVDQVHAHHGYFAGVYFYMVSYGRVSNSVLHDFYDYGMGGIGGGGNADCLGSSASNTPTQVYGYHLFKNNHLYNCSDDGIDTWTSQFNTIEGNVVHHAGYSNASNGGSNSMNEPIGNGNGFKLGTGGNNIVRNNVAYDNLATGFDDNSGSGTLLLNNTAFNTNVTFALYTAGNTAKNNLGVGGSPLLGGNPVQAANSWNLNITNPQFVSTDPASPNFLRLSMGSPAIDVGVDVGLPFNGTAPDLGAFEFAPVVDVAPGPPSNLQAK